MKRVIKKTKKVTTEDLAIMVAQGFNRVDKRFDKVGKDISGFKKDVEELKEDIKDVHKDILNLGDRFVSYHTFDSLANRVKVLEEKK